MKQYKLVFYILLISFIWISCESDKVNPIVVISSPDANTTFNPQDVLTVDALITDDKELDFAVITLKGPDDSSISRNIELSGISQTIAEVFTLDYNLSGIISINLIAYDKSGNNSIIERNFNFNSSAVGKIDLNIKLQYNGEPLVMFESYAYPDGKKIEFTRCSFYTSELKLDNTTINEVEFHNLTNSHSSLDLSNNGYSWTIENVATGDYNTLSFNIGVQEEYNNLDPGEFPSGHPLAKPAENWFSWMSYIFLKVEGKVDLNGDGIAETGVALHTGSNAALRNIVLTYPIKINANESTDIDLVFDLYNFFEGTTRIFPIEENPQIHSLSQIDAVIELSDNLIKAINKF